MSSIMMIVFVRLFYICFVGGSCFIYTICFYIYWCPTQFPYQMIIVSYNSNMTGVTSRAGTAYHSSAPALAPGF